MKTKLAVLTAAALVAWGLKRHYSDARAEDLVWILGPTTAVAGMVTQATFAWQPGEGYFSRDELFVIEKACAGVNFMIAAFGMLLVAFVHRAGSRGAGVRILGLSLLASYGAAVLVNAMRIAVAMKLAPHPYALRAFSAADVHRVEGILVYFGALCLLYEAAQWLDDRVSVGGRRGGTEGPDSKVER